MVESNGLNEAFLIGLGIVLYGIIAIVIMILWSIAGHMDRGVSKLFDN